ncbi:MAG: hypothetical protein U5R31_06210 [Acidimicrobiia bacterium]|nr:hypothetical protein [Acidimicrobiia bacterium]
MVESGTGRVLSVDRVDGNITELAVDTEGLPVGVADLGPGAVVVTDVISGELRAYSALGVEILAVLDEPTLVSTAPVPDGSGDTEIQVATSTGSCASGRAASSSPVSRSTRPYGVAPVPAGVDLGTRRRIRYRIRRRRELEPRRDDRSDRGRGGDDRR